MFRYVASSWRYARLLPFLFIVASDGAHIGFFDGELVDKGVLGCFCGMARSLWCLGAGWLAYDVVVWAL